MISSEISPDFLVLAQVLADDLASEIDLHYEDEDMGECADAIGKLQKLQNMIASEPTEVVAHIIERFRKATQIGVSGA
jgi:hypothetical protein